MGNIRIVTIINNVIRGVCEITSTDAHPLLENQFYVKNEKVYAKIYNHIDGDVVSMKVDEKTNTITSIKISARLIVTVPPWSLLRAQRDRLLKQSDWTQQSDVKLSNKEEWVTWRQSLRDIPKDFPLFENAEQALKELVANIPT